MRLRVQGFPPTSDSARDPASLFSYDLGLVGLTDPRTSSGRFLHGDVDGDARVRPADLHVQVDVVDFQDLQQLVVGTLFEDVVRGATAAPDVALALVNRFNDALGLLLQEPNVHGFQLERITFTWTCRDEIGGADDLRLEPIRLLFPPLLD